MDIRTVYASIGALALTGAAACTGGNLAEQSSSGTSRFKLQSCTSDADCDPGTNCLVEKCDASGCVPDAAGLCTTCPAEGAGLCMPATDGGTGAATAACFSGRLGDPSACELQADWGRRAVDTCAVQGAELTDLHSLSTCADGRPGGVAFTCCDFGGGTKPVDPPVEPPFPGPDCVTMTGNVDGSNADPAFADPKMAADQQCQAMGLELRDLQIQPDASGAPVLWTATCCGGTVTPPAPDPGACTRISVTADPNNPDPAFADPKMAAYEQCAAMGLVLQDLAPGEMDAAGNVWTWMATCCQDAAQPPTPPAPDPATCTDVPLGDGSCDATLDLKTQALQLCLDQGMALADVRIRYTCADGTIGAIIATCCP